MSLNVYMDSIRQQRQRSVKRSVCCFTWYLLSALQLREGHIKGAAFTTKSLD